MTARRLHHCFNNTAIGLQIRWDNGAKGGHAPRAGMVYVCLSIPPLPRGPQPPLSNFLPIKIYTVMRELTHNNNDIIVVIL